MNLKNLLPMFLGLLLAMTPLGVQAQSGPFAQLVSLTHACGSMGGSVEFELLGDPSSYNYYWEHGPTDLILTDLEPGSYTFVVENFYGCVEKYDVEILVIGDCDLQYFLYNSSDHCYTYVNMTVYSNGTPVSHSALDFVWSDGYTGGLNRSFLRHNTVTYCVTITSNGSDGNCCVLEQCFTIYADPLCKKCKKAVLLVNETGIASEGGAQFTELAVRGDCDCEKGNDIRGFSLDDNNGLLIPGNEFISSTNSAQIGVNAGYLSFTQNEVWSTIPNGSLILIYDGDAKKLNNIPAEDPTDANNDGVYVIASNNAEYLLGKTGLWNEQSNVQDYGGSIINPSWSLVRQDDQADGMQTRDSEGELSHGVSRGNSPFASDNTFPLWLGDANCQDCITRFIGMDPSQKEDFEYGSISAIQPSPGFANSDVNTKYLEELRDCDDRPPRREKLLKSMALELGGDLQLNDELVVSPNPFRNQLNLDLFSIAEGKATVSIHSIAGQELLRQEFSVEKGQNNQSMDIGQTLSAGIYVLRYVFPSGEEKNVRIVRMADY